LGNIVVNGVVSFILASRIGFTGPLIGSIVGSTVGVLLLSALLLRRTRARWILPRLPGPAVGAGLVALGVWLGLDHPGSWPSFVVTAVIATLAFFTSAVFAERVPVRSIFGGSRKRPATS